MYLGTAMHILKKLKIGDYVIILALLVLSFFPLKYLSNKQAPTDAKKTQLYAVIRVNNQTVKKISLAHNTVWRFNKDGEENTVEVKNQRIRVVYANCKDQLCVKQGWKDSAGQTIVCLPHKFLIEIKNGDKSKDSSNKKFDHTLVNP